MTYRDVATAAWGGWSAVAVAALLLAFLGPYGTFDTMSLPLRLVYWGAAAVLLTLLVRGVMWLIRRTPFFPKGCPNWALRTVAAVIAAAPGAYLVSSLHAAVLHAVTGANVHMLPFIRLYGYTVLPTLLATLFLPRQQASIEPAFPQPPASVAPAEPPQVRTPEAVAAAFVARVVPRLRDGRLLALEAEDHYLRVHTDRGSDLVLMRLRDAVAELAGVPGLQVHRSFWVAEAGVAQVVRRGQSWQVLMAGGLAVPVSRNYGASLRAAGWPKRYAASEL